MIRILVVCMGNICRSPTASAVLQGLALQQAADAATQAATWARALQEIGDQLKQAAPGHVALLASARQFCIAALALGTRSDGSVQLGGNLDTAQAGTRYRPGSPPAGRSGSTAAECCP